MTATTPEEWLRWAGLPRLAREVAEMRRAPVIASDWPELEHHIVAAIEAYEMFEESGKNTGVHYRTLAEYLRISLWDAGYRLTSTQ